MQPQICPRCKFRLTSAKAICNTCGYALQSGRRAVEPAAAAPKQIQPTSSSHTSPSSSTASMRKAQTNASSGGSFWRAFFGLDPLPAEKSDRDERALGET